jgi:Zn-dependent protease with chaperone function
VGNYRLDCEVYPGLSLRSWLSLAAVSFTFHLGLWVAPLAAAVMMPPTMSAESLLLVAALAGFNLFVAMDGWIYPLRWLGMIRPAPANIGRLVQEQADAKGICVNGAWVLDAPSGNAFASVFRNEVGFTSRLLQEHPEPEISAIVAHEFGHLSESRWARAGRLMTAFVLFPFVLLQPASEVYGLRGVAAVLLATIVLVWFRGRLLRRMELRADKLASDGGIGGEVYAQALARLYETNQIPAVMPKRNRMPHPDLYERMLAAGVTPDFPRPAPAAAQTWTGRLLTLALVGLLGARIAVDVMENGPSPDSVAAPEELITGQRAPAN